MVRFRRFSFEDLNESPPPSVDLPVAGLSFIQQMRLYLMTASAQQKKSPFAVVMHGQIALCWLDVDNDRMMTAAPSPVALPLLQKLVGTENSTLALSRVTEQTFIQRASVSSALPLRPTLWNIGLEAGGHQQPIFPLQEDATLRLRRWPDFRILAKRPDHFRLCALLVKQAASVQACCEALDLPRETVQAFFNAAFLSAYAIPVTGAAPQARVSRTDGLANLWRQLRTRWSA